MENDNIYDHHISIPALQRRFTINEIGLEIMFILEIPNLVYAQMQ